MLGQSFQRFTCWEGPGLSGFWDFRGIFGTHFFLGGGAFGSFSGANFRLLGPFGEYLDQMFNFCELSGYFGALKLTPDGECRISLGLLGNIWTKI